MAQRTAKTNKADHTAEERYELIGRVASGLAHELNGPIGISLGFNELARDLLARSKDGFIATTDMAKLNEYLTLTETANVRARTLARRISAFAKMAPGKTSHFDLVEAVEEAAALSSPALKNAQIEVLRKSAEYQPAGVNADRAVIVTAFVRLFLLAPESLPGGGSVIWDIQAPGRQAAGQVNFVLTAEAWGQTKAAAWPIPDEVRQLFATSNGMIGPSVSRMPRTNSRQDVAVTPVWELPGSLPGVELAASSGAGADSSLVHKQAADARQARPRRNASAK